MNEHTPDANNQRKQREEEAKGNMKQRKIDIPCLYNDFGEKNEVGSKEK